MMGQTLGHYKILDKLGAGGMGEVYRAEDTTLGREVAIKVLPEAFTDDPERLARFEQEAKLLATLNHPHIAQIHSLEEEDGQEFLVMELVEGETLSEHIALGPIPLEDALQTALQVAQALEAAHERGIVHRDLKPANIKITPAGEVKVLDFGLAKPITDATTTDISHSPTLTYSPTQAGVLLGTAAYMSPEQARGQEADKRSDIWAFGVVLWEMLTGNRLFDGDTVSDILAAVLCAEPDWQPLPANTPAVLRILLRWCLEKDPKQRLHDASDARILIEESLTDSWGTLQTVGVAGPARDRRVSPFIVSTVFAAGVAVVLVLAGGLAGWRLSRTGQPESPPTKRFAIILPGLATGASDVLLALSRDGRTLVYRGTGEGTDQLYRRPMDQLEVSPIWDTGGASNPFLSPNGNWVGFFAKGKLKKVSLAGGSSFTICDAPMWSTASWGSDDTIVFRNRNSGLSRVSADGGVPEQLTTAKSEGEVHWSPHFLPGGNAVLFTVWSGTGTRRIVVYSFDTKEQRLLVDGAGPHFSSGHIIFWRGGSLWAAPFDVDQLERTGDPFPVLEGIRSVTYATPQFDVADDGTLVYVAYAGTTDRTLVWVDRQGREEPTALPPAEYYTARVSPDGTRVAVQVQGDVWIAELARGTLTTVTSDPWVDFLPIWTPDGHRVVFDSHREEPVYGLFWKAADGTGPTERLMSIEHDLGPSGWSPDGKTLLFEYWFGAQHMDIGVFSMEGERAWEPLLQTESNETAPAVSPDGRWIAYASDETGQYEVYLQRFPELGKRHLISTGGGIQPLWSPDGKELFYRRWDDDAMMVVPIDTEPTLGVGNPEDLFKGPYSRFPFFPFFRVYDIAPDGRRFLMIKEDTQTDETSASKQIIIILNWFKDLEQLMATEQ